VGEEFDVGGLGGGRVGGNVYERRLAANPTPELSGQNNIATSDSFLID
jgi:hypothetical protein